MCRWRHGRCTYRYVRNGFPVHDDLFRFVEQLRWVDGDAVEFRLQMDPEVEEMDQGTRCIVAWMWFVLETGNDHHEKRIGANASPEHVGEPPNVQRGLEGRVQPRKERILAHVAPHVLPADRCVIGQDQLDVQARCAVVERDQRITGPSQYRKQVVLFVTLPEGFEQAPQISHASRSFRGAGGHLGQGSVRLDMDRD